LDKKLSLKPAALEAEQQRKTGAVPRENKLIGNNNYNTSSVSMGTNVIIK